ncbi:MAG: response regulator, partial [Euryarchaeota archaeon]|nr:response regulator [Euryarchaeota archaeon]
MGKERILVVEDQKIVAEDIKEILTQLGYEVVGISSTGEDAIKKADRTRPHLVLMDIRLKGEMDGIEAAKEIRNRFRIPVVYLTAYSDEKTLQRAKVTEPFGYIIKPFEDRELHSIIEMALYRHEMEEEVDRYREELEEMVKERTAELTVAMENLQKEVKEREAAEAELRELKDLMESVLDSTGEMIFSLDNSMVITSWNKEAGRILGYRKPEVVGKNFHDVPGFAEARELEEILSKPIDRRKESETVVKTKKGDRRVFKFAVTPLMNHEGEVAGYVVSGRDVTLLKQVYERVMAGNSYIFREGGLERPCNVLKNLKDRGFDILIITRTKPEIIEAGWNLEASYVRLAAMESGGEGSHKGLEEIRAEVESHLREHPRSAVLLDRIDYLITVFDFKEVLLLIYRLNDLISASESIFLVNVPRELLTEQEYSLFRQEFQEFPDLEEMAREELSYEAYEILRFVASRDVTTLKDIADKFSITRPTVNKRVDELKGKGFITTRKQGLYTVLVL